MRARPPVVVSGLPEEEADLLPDLVDEDEAGLRPGDDGGQLPQGLGHQAGLEAHMGVAHLPFELGLGDEGGDRIDHDHVHRAAPDEDLGDLEALLAEIGLGDEEVVDVDADLGRVGRGEGVLGVDEGGLAAHPLGRGDDMEGEGRLPRRLRPVDLDDAAAGESPDARGPGRRRSSPSGSPGPGWRRPSARTS